ncbi:hypothetical protein AB0M95_20280 [Sphaerisporangium sp. NPDC051017]|uniref:hypothetical protein n=1 Tax=Sphaerisporangium sp. NPDC051017 TaxID=3154636 RepID=UPI003443D178
MKPRNRAAALAATATLTTALLIGTAPAALAVPTNCSTSSTPATVSSYCATGTGEHQVAVTVLHVNPMVGYVYSVGPWVPAGQTSTAQLPPGQIVNLRVNTR